MQQQVQVPTKEQLEAAVTQMLLQRGALKEQLEQLDKQIVPVQAQLQLLQAQEAVAAQEETPED